MIEGDWHRNQYLCYQGNIENLAKWNRLDFVDELTIYSHPDAGAVVAVEEQNAVAVIGIMIDPLASNRTEKQIAHSILKDCQTQDELTEYLQQFTGRYVVLFRKGNVFSANPDACAFRRIFYGKYQEKTVLTSSPKLFLDAFDLKQKISDDKLEIINNPTFKRWESPWFGYTSHDNRLAHLLPNYYLQLPDLTEKRTKIFFQDFKNEKEILAYTAELLKGSLKGMLAKKAPLIQAITAGWDSRMALAAVKENLSEIEFFILDMQDKPIDKKPDQYVSRALTKKLGIPFRTEVFPELSEDFLSTYQKNFIYPRLDPKIRNIQWHHTHTKGWINTNTNGSEVARCVYYQDDEVATPEYLANLFHLPFTKFVENEFEKWLEETASYAKENQIPLFDLFFWEQRQGNWGALNACEKDIAVEDVSPFNNKNLLLAWLQIPDKKRRYMHYTFFRKFIKYLWPEVLSEPINPEPFMTYVRYNLGVVPRRWIFGK